MEPWPDGVWKDLVSGAGRAAQGGQRGIGKGCRQGLQAAKLGVL